MLEHGVVDSSEDNINVLTLSGLEVKLERDGGVGEGGVDDRLELSVSVQDDLLHLGGWGAQLAPREQQDVPAVRFPVDAVLQGVVEGGPVQGPGPGLRALLAHFLRVGLPKRPQGDAPGG